ncbi:NAD(P)-binding protein [Amniculicola lignicola CBS 123094]|uniref:NAD(P)-binding protein n=1 Tax=Amniculicola lignicola CBS 123094 TaxID=1392246 RepID=A0A6A5WUK2_9PLEO|nr:NAD(P)-binding protein [Amniculicola lignicola CBS 123094]
MSASRTLVVFGSGPGVGNHVAAEFAAHGFNHVILLARNEARLQDDAAQVYQASSSVKVDMLRIDLSDLASIPAVLKKIDELSSDIEAILFNAARISGSQVLTTPIEELQEDFTVTNLALYAISQWGIPHLQARAKSNSSAKPSLLVPNSHLPWDPVPELLSLSLVKASQRNMVQSLSRAFTKDGVHIGLITIEGVVATDKELLNPLNIARQTWKFFESGTGLEVNIKE